MIPYGIDTKNADNDFIDNLINLIKENELNGQKKKKK